MSLKKRTCLEHWGGLVAQNVSGRINLQWLRRPRASVYQLRGGEAGTCNLDDEPCQWPAHLSLPQ